MFVGLGVGVFWASFFQVREARVLHFSLFLFIFISAWCLYGLCTTVSAWKSLKSCLILLDGLPHA